MSGLNITAQKMQKSSRYIVSTRDKPKDTAIPSLTINPPMQNNISHKTPWLYIFLERIDMFPSLREEAHQQIPSISASSHCGINMLKMPTEACEF